MFEFAHAIVFLNLPVENTANEKNYSNRELFKILLWSILISDDLVNTFEVATVKKFLNRIFLNLLLEVPFISNTTYIGTIKMSN